MFNNIRFAVTAVGVALAGFASCRAEDFRTWTDSSGKRQVKAALVRVVDQKVTLRKLNGTEKTVPLHIFSAADRHFVALHNDTTLQQPSGMLTKIVPLDLKLALYSVNVVPGTAPPDDLLCDLGVKGSDVILVDETASEVFIKDGEVMKRDIKPGDKFQFVFQDAEGGAKIAVDVVFVKRAKSVSLQLRPSITDKGFIKQQRLLERKLGDAQSAIQNLPEMRQNLGTLSWERNRAAALARAAYGEFAGFQASRNVFILDEKIRKLRNLIAKGELLIQNQPAAANDLDRLLALGAFAKQVASKAHVHVRIHDGRRTLLAKTVDGLPPQARTDRDEHGRGQPSTGSK